ALSAVARGPAPVLEGTFDEDSAVKLLPKDGAGNIDWLAAERRGIIRPRSALPGRPAADAAAGEFGYDFIMPNADTSYDVSFAHSVHAQQMSCATCHPRLFPRRGTKITMDDLGKGAFCAPCHDKVAFPVETGCERCHTRLPPAEGGAKPQLLGTSTLQRAKPDTAAGKGTEGVFAGLGTDQLPASRFPHWVHRGRYACKACHSELFVPKAGANVITMKLMADGKACGACHDGKNAFGVGLNNCDRCHTPAVVPAPKK
ncbi:MAG: hypothetical protein NTW72_04600, partial [Gemmatimonadetes bacterium]|nr:hypothetical protein [Gemmatimonadota bacterium]